MSDLGPQKCSFFISETVTSGGTELAIVRIVMYGTVRGEGILRECKGTDQL